MGKMSHYLAARCSQCSKWIPVRQCEADDPTFDPSIFIQVLCPHCGKQSKLNAKALEVVPESKLQSS
jgi:hypothetical protein